MKLALRGTAFVQGAMLYRGAALLLSLSVGALMALAVGCADDAAPVGCAENASPAGCADDASPPMASSLSPSTTTATATTATVVTPPATSAQTGGAAAGYWITAEETKRLLDSGAPVVVVDVRSASDFGESHLKGALSIPLEVLPSRYGEIPAGLPVIVCAACA